MNRNSNSYNRILPAAALLLAPVLAIGAPLATEVDPALVAGKGKEIVEGACSVCHKIGALSAPRLGNRDEWAPRVEKGIDRVIANAIEGFNAMPPKGGQLYLSDEETAAAALYMVGLVDGSSSSTAAEEPPGPKTSRPAEANAARTPAAAAGGTAKKPAEKKGETTGGRLAEVVAPAPGKEPTPAAARPVAATRANSFNRLLKPPSKRNAEPAKDGIHDPQSEGTKVLQHPKAAFANLKKSNSGNRVDWVASLNSGAINPRYDRDDPDRQPVVLDLNIIREVKGTMPDVVYPHKQHTEWLDCSNCHPAIFIPKKGANNISMASILLGEQCGVCHGKVAFPVSDCRKCHSGEKRLAQTRK